MPTGSNQVILNAAEIAAAQTAEANRQIALANARREEARLAGLLPTAKNIVDVIAPELTRTLQARGGESAERGLGTTAKSVQTQQETVINPYAKIGETIAGLSTPIGIPAPIYSTTSTGTSASQSAYDLLYEQFSQYGLGGLIEPLKGFIEEGISPAEFTIRLRNTDAYKKRFAANAIRIQKGLRALSEAEYIGIEDQYQNIMRNYGLPESYYARGEMGRQEGFEKFLSNDVSAAELEDRIVTAQNRVINAAPEISTALKSYYPDITNGDILAYALDPEQGLAGIKRKVASAEIGGAALMAGLKADVTRAEELQRYGVSAEQARQGFQTVAEVAPRGTQLSEFYKQSPYTQATAETEVFGLGGATEAAKQRKKLTQLEQASFSGSSGLTSGALARDRAGAF